MRGACMAAVALCLTACGGSGSDPAATAPGSGASGAALSADELFQGRYWFQSLLTRSKSGADTVTVSHGTLQADGQGTMAEQPGATLNNDGAVGTLNVPGPELPYAVGEDRAIQVYDPNNPGQVVAQGGLSASGDVALLGWTGVTAFSAYVQASDVVTDASDLAGLFHFAGFGKTPAGNVGFVGTMTFDGLGGLEYGVRWINDGGAVTQSPASLPGTYQIDSEGRIDVDLADASLRGRMTRSGDLLLLSGSRGQGEDPIFMALTRASIAATPSAISGSYFVVGAGASGSYVSFSGVARVDAPGTLTADLTVRTEATQTAGPLQVAYGIAVTPLGVLQWTGPGGLLLQGAISPTGDAFVVGGPVSTPNGGPGFWIGIRK